MYHTVTVSLVTRGPKGLSKLLLNLCFITKHMPPSIKMAHFVVAPILPLCDPTVLSKALQAYPFLYKENSPAFENTPMKGCLLKIREHRQVVNSCRNFLKGQTQSMGGIALKAVRT